MRLSITPSFLLKTAFIIFCIASNQDITNTLFKKNKKISVISLAEQEYNKYYKMCSHMEILSLAKCITTFEKDFSMINNFFDEAIDFVLHHEGYYSNDKNDKGGATKYGISLRYLRDNNIDVNRDGTIDIKDIQQLTKQQALELYKQDFWDKNHYYLINDPKIARKVLDMSVNMGSYEAHELIQAALNKFHDVHVMQDGILGNESFGAINLLIKLGKAQELYKAMQDEQAQYYVEIVKIHPEYKVFQAGWLRRASE